MKTAIRISNNIRLAFFPIAYGLSGALIGGTLNRIMIAELGLSATLVALFFTIPLLISPVRIWLGYRSDGFPIMGRRREPYIVLGAALIGLGVIAATSVPIKTADSAGLLVVGGFVAFLIYGLGRNLGQTTFQALLSDRFEGDQRPRAITLYEVATLLGLVMGAGGLGSALETYDPARLIQVSIGVAIVILILATFAALGQEPHSETVEVAAEKARVMPFGQVLRDFILADPQVRLFFTLVFFTFVGTLAQDVLLEPYGALVLGMEVGETTRLTAFWGVGVMISMLLSGTILIKWLGYMKVMRLGIISSAFVFIGVIVSGAMGNPDFFRSLVFVMGLGTGLAGAGMLTGVITFTTVIRAGMLLGVWGVANMVGHAFGSLMGGAVVDIVRSLTGNAFAAYATVFSIEVIFLLVALYFSTRLSMDDSKAYAEEHQEIPLVTAE